MAVLDALPYLDVSIRVAGQRVVEYDYPDDLEGTSSRYESKKYIESTSGTIFSIVTRVGEQAMGVFLNEPPDKMMEVCVYIDGKWRHGVSVRQRTIPHFCEITGSVAASAVPGMNEMQLFKFKSVTTVDDATKARVEQDSKIAKDLGVIMVSVNIAQELGRMDHFRGFRQENGNFEISEKSLKGRSVSLGTELVSGGLCKDPGVITVGNRKTLGRYFFYYRSRDDLKKELIIPRSPSPVADGPNHVDSLSSEELRRLAGERLAQITGNTGVKTEGCRGVKRERSLSSAPKYPGHSRYKIIRTGDGRDTIDLTDD